MNNFREWLSGKKTYLVAIGVILAAVIAWAGGSLDTAQLVEAVVAAVIAATLRAGVAKSGPPSVKLIIPFLLPLVLAGGCVGTRPLSSSQQYGIASASVRATVDSLTATAAAKLISDSDIVLIDPVVTQAFDSLRAMRTAVLTGNTVTVQWYLAQVQQLVSKITAMALRAEELKNVDNSSSSLNGNYRGNEYRYGADPGPGRSRGRYARLHARRDRRGRTAQRPERGGLGGDSGGGESALSRWRPGKPIPPITVEIEYD